MTTTDDYIQHVIGKMPRATPLREQIAQELRGHFAERLNRGQSIDDVVRQLGDPDALAESYLSAVPLVPVSFGQRAAAKLLDALAIDAVLAVIGFLIWVTGIISDWQILPMLGLGVGVLSLPLYTTIAEHALGYTVGKRVIGLRVVQESGARISLGQSIVRQLPIFAQVLWIDMLFALFTEKHQRAFEMLSKTRVVAA